MNKEIKKGFENIKKATSDFKSTVRDDYVIYEKARNKARIESEKFVEKQSAYDEMEKKARAALLRGYQDKKDVLKHEFERLIDVLKKNYDEYTSSEIKPIFLHRLNTYKENGIVPSFKEAEALLRMAKDSLISMRILNKYFQEHKEEINYKFEGFADSESFENDIEQLERYAAGQFFWMPIDVAGDVNISGMDAVVKSMHISTFDTMVSKTFDDINKRWSEQIPPRIGQLVSYRTELTDSGYISAKEQFEADIETTNNGKLSKINSGASSGTTYKEPSILTETEVNAQTIAAYY